MQGMTEIATIPIVNGEFEYKFTSNEIEAYVLIFEEEFFKGAMMPIKFFSENELVTLKLHDTENFMDNVVNGGELNDEFQNFQNSVVKKFYDKSMSIEEAYRGMAYELFYSDDYNAVMTKLRNAKTQEEKVPLYEEMKRLTEKGLDKSDLGKEREVRSRALFNIYLKDKYDYIEKNTNLVSFYLMMEDLTGIK